ESKHADFGDAVAQIQQLTSVVARLIQLGAQVIQKQGIEDLQNVGHAGVVHAQGAAFLIIGYGLDHGTKDVRVDLRPVQVAHVEQVRTGNPAEAMDFEITGTQATVNVGESICPG